MRLLIVLGCAAALALAQPKPDFTGTWALNVEKSNFDRQPAPQAMTDKIDHKDPTLTINSTRSGEQGSGEFTLKYVTDGSEGSNDVMGNPLKYTAKFDGEILVITTWGSFGPNEIKLIDKWSLSPEKNMLTIRRHYEGRGGPQDQVLIMDRKKE
jgi:hypothetical protein